MGTALGDIGHILRVLTRSPSFAAPAVLSLALATGLTVAVSEAVQAVVFRPIVSAELSDVYSLLVSDDRTRPFDLTVSTFRAVGADLPRSVSSAFGFLISQSLVRSSTRAADLFGQSVSAGYATTLALRPQLGRWIDAGDDLPTSAPVAVISDRIWRAWFEARRDIVGRSMLSVAGHSFVIVGVAPSQFRGVEGHVDWWVPLATYPVLRSPTTRQASDRGASGVQVMLKGRSGISRENILVEVAASIERNKDTTEPNGIRVRLNPALGTGAPPGLRTVGNAIVLMAGVLFLATCANVVTMFYARGLRRMPEMAVRLSLGATRGRLIGVVLTEAALVSVVSAILGAALGASGLVLLERTFPDIRLDRYLPIFLDLSPGRLLLQVSTACALVAMVLIGLAMATFVNQTTRRWSLTASGASPTFTDRLGRVRSLIVMCQVAAVMVLLMGARIVLANLPPSFNKRVLFDAGNVAVGHVRLGTHGYNDDRGQAFLSRLIRSIRERPSITGAGFADRVPGGVGEAAPTAATIAPESVRPGEVITSLRATASCSAISPGFLRAIGLPILRGRDFGDGDTRGADRVAIVSESAARALWPNGSPLGKRLTVGLNQWLTVVGVVADPVSGPSELRQDLDVPSYALLTAPGNHLFLPFDQWRQYDRAIVVVGSTNPAAAVSSIDPAVRFLDDSIPVLELGTLQEALAAAYAPQRAAKIVSFALGLAAVVLAVLALYSLISYIVIGRLREFAVRAAIGASPYQLFRLIFDSTIRIVLFGLLPGTLVVALGSRFAAYSLTRLIPNDLTDWVVVLTLLLVIGVAAGVSPAWRAMRTNPGETLRVS